MKIIPKKAAVKKKRPLRKPVAAKSVNSRKKKAWDKGAYAAGCRSVGWFWPKSIDGEPPENIQWERTINVRWAKWFGKYAFRRVPQLSYPLACRRFIRGFCETANIDISSDLLLPTTKSVCCVLTVKNEAATLQTQLNELRRLPFEEIIVVVNGSTDNSYEVARNHPVQATVVHFDSALGYDVGRAVGARMSHSDMILFLDGDMTIRVDLLLPFIYEIEKGADVVLNPISSLLPTFERRDSVSNIKQFLNICLGRRDLHADSLTAVPHALSRRAIEKLGTSVLAVPPVAQERAVRLGLSVVRSPVTVDVITRNRLRKQNVGLGNRVEHLILGDHLEALHELMGNFGPRLHFPDSMRQRHIIEEGADESV
ncbi:MULTISPECIES: glycosyltransferase [unclassified Paenibacillus]|uniref:glycosyltransferase family 2 protein n=1 Tax=unclassified Paenibacillus TaxID=185978 RepID=UPI0019155451|nr:glycosyltransferase [Paenibacillus sp. EPM92]